MDQSLDDCVLHGIARSDQDWLMGLMGTASKLGHGSGPPLAS